MKALLLKLCLLFVALSSFGAVPDYKAFIGTNGIIVRSNPPIGTIIIDGSAISGSAVPGGSTYSVQWNTNGSFAGDGRFQYTPELGGGDPSARLRLSYNTATNIFSAIGIGSESAHEFFLMSGGLTRWGVGTSGDLNPFSDAAGYSIGTVGLNRRPMLVNVQAAFQVDDKYALSKAANVLSVGNHVSWTDLVLLTDGQDRLHIASGGNVGIGTAFPTAHLTVSNATITGPIFAAYASNNPAPAIIVESNSWVGLGTNVPAARLHVRPSMSAAVYSRIDDTNGTPRIQMGILPGVSDFGAIWLGEIIPTGGNFTFMGNTTDSYFNAPTTMRLSTAGTTRWIISSAGHFTAGADNTYDIGASGATRPRNYFGAGNMTIAGTTTLGGVVSLPAITAGRLLQNDSGTELAPVTLGGGHTLASDILSHTNLVLANTTNQIVFGATNIPPANTTTPTKWISVQIQGESVSYRLPLYN